MSRRRLCRQAAVQVLFQDDFNASQSRDWDHHYLREQLEGNHSMVELAWWMIDGTRARRKELDALIEPFIEHWKLHRLTAIDRNIIRLACFEHRFGDTPLPVVIDEAVRMAKRFGSKDSPDFVNGVLDGLLKSDPTAATSPARALHKDPAEPEETAGPGHRPEAGPGELSAPIADRQDSEEKAGSQPAAKQDAPRPSGLPGLRRFIKRSS